MAETLRDSRWNLRVTGDANALVRRAASSRRQNLSEFVVEAALSEAERVLAERDRFVLGEADWLAFLEALDRPVQENPGLARLFAKPNVFD
jgi:uncharacterized protein (DUF1778 family)